MTIGSWAEWASALAAFAAAVLSAVAVVLAAKANQTAKASLERDELRERAAVARQLQAWWAKWDDQGGSKYGVVVSNAGDGATVFRNVRIETIGNDLVSDPERNSITFATLPPGTYFVESKNRQSTSSVAWENPQPIGDLSTLTPLLGARKLSVTRIRFVDAVGASWEWKAGSLQKASDPPLNAH